MSHFVLLYYKFTCIADPAAFAEAHRSLCESLQLRGRILIGAEGINGTVSGTAEDCDAYMQVCGTLPELNGIEFKVDAAEGHAFKALYVRVREEIITLGRPLAEPVHTRSGKHLSPSEFRAKMREEDTVILDGRNAYESELGRFEGALCPDVQNFREFPDWIESHREQLQGKQILTYCTGGIRCEKLTSWMLDAGFEDVYQLDGGIVMYGQDPATDGEGFEGVNVVFDERVVVPVGSKSKIVTRCRECDRLCADYVNCANVECNLRMILCPECESRVASCCSDVCRTAPRLRQKGKKWHESRTWA